MDGLKMEVKFKDLLFIYEHQISKNVKNKKKLLNFERNKFQNLINIYYELKNNNYRVEHYNIFLIREPKKRIVMSLSIHDKIINHYVTEFILKPKLEKYLDHRNIATRKNMGSDYGIRRRSGGPSSGHCAACTGRWPDPIVPPIRWPGWTGLDTSPTRSHLKRFSACFGSPPSGSCWRSTIPCIWGSLKYAGWSAH